MEFIRQLLGLRAGEKSRTGASTATEHGEPHESYAEPAEPPPPYPDEAESLQTRPLEPPKLFRSARRQVRVGQLSDTGQVRSTNQDACLTFVATPETSESPPPIGFFVVADGMGGHSNGELASRLAVQTLSSHVLQGVVIPHLDGREHSSSDKTVSEVLVDAMAAANRAVHERVADGGTTVTSAIIRGDLAYLAHVGDSRAYVISEGSMELITRDHSLVRRLQELGQLSDDEAASHPQRNVLYRAIGQGEGLEIDTVTRRLPPASRLLICSDGLWGVLGDDRMLEILEGVEDPQAACNRLVAEANASGGPDNITIVLVQMPH